MPDEHDVVRPGLRVALAELDDHLTRLRFTGRSRDRSVSAVVNGQSALLEVVVDDEAPQGRFPERIGQAITEAVTSARTRSGGEAARLVAQTLDPGRADPDLTAPEPPESPAPRPVARGGKRRIVEFGQAGSRDPVRRGEFPAGPHDRNGYP